MIKRILRNKQTQFNKKQENKNYKEYLDEVRKIIVHYESLEQDYEIVAYLLGVKSKFFIPTEELKNMDGVDICFYVLNSVSFKSLAEYTESVTPEIEEIFTKLTREEVVCRYTMEDSVNLLYFYGNLLPHDGVINLVYNIIDKCHGDMGVYTTITKNLVGLKNIEAIEIVYSAITFKYGEDVAKKLMEVNGLKVDFSKRNKIL